MRTRIRALAGAVAIMLVLGLAACGGDDDETESSDTTVTEESDAGGGDTTTTVAPTPDDLAIAAYNRAWEAMFAASNPPNPMHPSISESLTGVAAQSIAGVVIEQQNAGQHTVGSMQTHPEVVSSTADEVLLRDCTVEDSTTYDTATNAVVEEGSGIPRSREAEVVNQEGTWRVSVIRTLEDACTP